jgi:hypothetical protein
MNMKNFGYLIVNPFYPLHLSFGKLSCFAATCM